jgi:molecular chaperone GrpE (heat shock protein)
VHHLGEQVKHGLEHIHTRNKTVGDNVVKVGNDLHRVVGDVHQVKDGIGKIVEAVQALAKDAVKRQKAYDQLYTEMRDYKNNFIDAAQKPLYMEMILLFDSVQRAMRKYEEAPETTLDKGGVLQAMTQIKDELLEILYRRDIELIEDAPKKLDVNFQKPIRRIEVDNPAEDREVAQRVRDGFRRNGTVLRPQEVVVKRCVSVPSDEAPIPAPSGEGPVDEKDQAPSEDKPADASASDVNTPEGVEK